MGDLIYQDSAVVMSCTVRQTDKEQCMTENLETLSRIVSPETRDQNVCKAASAHLLLGTLITDQRNI